MGGFFGVVSTGNCVKDLFYGTDYHSHLGNQRGGLLVYDKEKGFTRYIHDIRNSQFRSKFQYDVESLKGNMGIGSISDTGDQPLMAFSHVGTFGIVMVGAVTNIEQLERSAFRSIRTHFSEMTGENVNPAEMVASLISMSGSYADGFRQVQEKVQGSCSILLLTKEGIYAVRDRYGRTPVVIGSKTEVVDEVETWTTDDGVRCERVVKKEEKSYAVTFETCAFNNLEYKIEQWLGPGEAVLMTPDGVQQVLPPLENSLHFCTFMWVYYGYPASSYENVNVEAVRYECGAALARRDAGNYDFDAVAGVPDSGTAHALGYASESHLPYKRSFVKYTPTWPRSFIPPDQSDRAMVAKMKLISIPHFIKDKKLLFCEDSIVRGTQLGNTFMRLRQGDISVKEVHIRSACPPILFNCPYLNFSRAKSLMELAARRAIADLEDGNYNAHLDEYMDETSERYKKMVEWICKDLKLDSLKYQKLDDLLEAVMIVARESGNTELTKECLCTYCWNGRDSVVNDRKLKNAESR
ncbi:MAG: amidophosphoribosyltransferase [Victivallales bacterium]|nr:amidophosphoribosyltransferase [Victivallales bacterium]